MHSGITGSLGTAPIRANFMAAIAGRVGPKPISFSTFVNGSYITGNKPIHANSIVAYRVRWNGFLDQPNFQIRCAQAMSVLENYTASEELLYTGNGPNNRFVRIGGGVTGAQHGVAIGSAANAGIGSISISPTDGAQADNVSIGIGVGATATGTDAISIGRNCSATHRKSVALSSGVSSRAGFLFYSPDQTYQAPIGVASAVTTNATPTRLQVIGPSNISIPSGRMVCFFLHIGAIRSDGGSAAYYVRKGAIKNVAGTTSLIGTVETIGTDIEDNAATDVAVTANNTDDCLDIHVTGIAGETWRWEAVCNFVEFPYGT